MTDAVTSMPRPQRPTPIAAPRPLVDERRSSAEFDKLVDGEYAAVARLVRRLLGWDDGADDVVQEVFLAAWRHWGRFRGGAAAATWLRRIAVNKCRSRMRRNGVRRRWQRWWRQTADAAQVAVMPAADDDGVAAAVRAAVQTLPPAYREVTVLHYLEQMTIEQIAELLGVRRNTVDVRLLRARRQLADMLKEVGEP